MAVSRDEVRAVARLARLRLTDEELDRFADQLGAILDHVAALDAATLEDADESGTSRGGRPGAEEAEAGAPLRAEDEPPDRLRRPVAELAPAWEGGFFTVPRLPALDEDVVDEASSGGAGGGSAAPSPGGSGADGDDA